MTADILKIQKSVRKSIKDYAIESNHGEDALVMLISVDLYLALGAKETPARPPSKCKPTIPPLEVVSHG